MANPEYEAKVNPADLYNDEILEQFEAIRNVIHKEILPSTYNELIVTSNQAGVFNNWYNFDYYPSTELIFPLSPQSGNINWLEKNFLRFKLTIQDNNANGCKLMDMPLNLFLFEAQTNNSPEQFCANSQIYDRTTLCVIDGASIFKSIELNYGGTAIWTSAYQQVEAFFTFANIPDQLTSSSPQYYTTNKDPSHALSGFTCSSSSCKYDSLGTLDTKSKGCNDLSQDTNFSKTDLLEMSLYIDIDVSRLSPLLSWMSLIPGFINKLTLRVVLDAPSNYLVLKYCNSTTYHKITKGIQNTEGEIIKWATNMIWNANNDKSGYKQLPKDGIKYYKLDVDCKTMSYSNIKWKMELCEIHQCNATMTEDTRIRLISLIQQMGGKWIYPCRYWNTTIAPIQNTTNSTNEEQVYNISLQFILTGCYFRSISFANILENNNSYYKSATPGQGLFRLPDITNIKIYADSELIVSYNSIIEVVTDTDSALIDNDKYTISRDIIASLFSETGENYDGIYRDCISKALGPPNGLYSGKYTSEKMGTHNIVIQLTYKQPKNTDYTFQSWLGALIDGVVVFDGFNGNYFTTGRKMQQVYEALS